MQFKSLLHFAAFTGTQAALQHVANHRALEKAAELLEHRAKEVIGTYDHNWTPLAESTKTDRVRQGYPADEPLLRSGKLRDSIKHTVSGNTARVGTNYDIGVYQELGTRSIPPRSYLRASAIEKEKEIVAILRHGSMGHLGR